MKKLGLLFLMFFLIVPVGAFALDADEEASTSENEVLAPYKPKFACYVPNADGGSFGGFSNISLLTAKANAKRNCQNYSKSKCLFAEIHCYKLVTNSTESE